MSLFNCWLYQRRYIYKYADTWADNAKLKKERIIQIIRSVDVSQNVKATVLQSGSRDSPTGVYTWEEWFRIVNSITVWRDVSAQGAPRESHCERLSPKPPRSAANSSVIMDQPGPQADQPFTLSGHWGHSQTQPLLPSPLYPYQNPYCLLKIYHKVFQGLSVTSQNSDTLARLCMKLKATEASFVTLAAQSRWIFVLLFIAVVL